MNIFRRSLNMFEISARNNMMLLNSCSYSYINRLNFGTVKEKQTGVVKWFNSTKGFGFISLSDGTGDIFVHQTQIYSQGYRSLGEGETVEFDIETDSTGKQKAINCTGPNGAPVQGDQRPPGGGAGGRGGSGGGGGGGGFNRDRNNDRNNRGGRRKQEDEEEEELN